MSTELQRQVNLQIKNNELAFLAYRSAFSKTSKKGKVSFLFDTNAEFYARKGVTTQTRIPIYEDIGQLRYLAEQGLLEIESLNTKIIRENFSSLFLNEPISIQHLTQKEANERLNILRKFIDYLVPFFLLDSAKFCIEYLIQAYDIHILLGEYLFLSFLPYHDMAEFLALVQTLDIPDTSEISGLTDSMKKTSATISSRNQLSIYLTKNVNVFNMLAKFWQEKLTDYNLTKNLALTNLVTWLCIEIIDELSKIKDSRNIEGCLVNIIDVIVLDTCLKNSKYEDLRCTGYCILFKLATPLLHLSFEIQDRIIREIFQSIFISKNFDNLLDSIPETLLLINHILVNLKTILKLNYLNHDISQFILDNSVSFINGIELLIKWDSDILQILTLIIKSILNFAFNTNEQYKEASIEFIKKVLQINGSNEISYSEKYTNIIKVIILNIIDIYDQNEDDSKYFDTLINSFYHNYTSEFISSLSFSLNLLNNNSGYSHLKKKKIELFLDKVLKEDNQDHNKQEKSTKMLLSLLNSEDKTVLKSCIEVICNLISKSQKDINQMTNIERRIFDISLRYYFDPQNLINDNEDYVLKLLKLSGTSEIIKFLDIESNQAQGSWRTLFVIKGILSYFKLKLNSISLKSFLSQELNSNISNLQDLIKFYFSKLFGKDFESKWIVFFENVNSLLINMDIIENKNLNSILNESSNIFLPLLIILSSFESSFDKKLRDITLLLLQSIFLSNRKEDYLNNLINQNQFNYLELILIIFSIQENENRLINSQELSINNLPFQFEYSDDKVLIILESLYYNSYYLIQNIQNQLVYSNNGSIVYNNGISILKNLRSIFMKVISRNTFNLNSKLLNIALIDTLEIGSSKKSELPSYQLFLSCFNYSKNINKISSLILALSANLFNIISNGTVHVRKFNKLDLKTNQLNLFYGRNIYYETLVSHSYSFLEILVSKLYSEELTTSDDNLILLTEVIYNLLIFSILPVISSHEFVPARIASLNLCKSIKKKLEKLDQKSLKSKFVFKKIIIKKDQNVYIKKLTHYLNYESISLNQILFIIEDILFYQNDIVVNLTSYYSIERKNNSDKINIFNNISKLNLIMIMQLIVENKHFNINYTLSYIRNHLIFENFDPDYHKILIKFLSFYIDNDISDISNIQLLFMTAFIRQGIDSLRLSKEEDLNKINSIIIDYCDLIKSFDRKLIIEQSNLIKFEAIDILGDIFVGILNPKILKLIDDHLNFITSVIFLVLYYTPKKINKINLIQLSETSLKKLDFLLVNIIKSCFDNYYDNLLKNKEFHDYLSEQTIIKWLYEQVGISPILTNQKLNDQLESCEYNVNENLVNQILRYMDKNKERIDLDMNIHQNEEISYLNHITKIESYLISILEYGIKNRKFNYKDIEKVMNYFNCKNYFKNSKIFSNPIIISSINCLFTNINFGTYDNEDHKKYFIKIYEALFSIYKNFVNSINSNFIEINYQLKITFSSLNLFIKHNLEECKYLDNQSIRKIKNILFNILIERQIKEITKFSKFENLQEILAFMETLYNQVIYKDELISFDKVQGIFIIINHYLSNNIDENTNNQEYLEDDQLDLLIKHLFKKNLFGNNVSIYNNLFENVLKQIETLIKYQELNNELGSKKCILWNLLVISKATIYFLNKTLLNIEVSFEECSFLMNLLDQLILLKTLIDKHFLKKWVGLLEDNEENVEYQSIDNKLRSKIDKLERNYLNLRTLVNFNKIDSINYKNIQKDIDELIQIIIESDTMKKYLILNWNFSKENHFKVQDNLIKYFDQLLINNKIDYFGIIIKESLENKFKFEFNNQEEEINLIHITNYLLNQINLELMNNQKLKINYDKNEFRTRMKIWIKTWYVFDLILKISDKHNKEKLIRIIFSKVVEFYKIFVNENNLEIKFKIPIIHNFLINRINEFDDKTILSMLNEVEIIVCDSIKTIRYLIDEENKISILENIANDKKISNMLTTMINSYYNITNFGDNEEYKHNQTNLIFLIPYLTLLNNIFNSRISNVILSIESIRKSILFDLLLNKDLTIYFELKSLIKLLKSERTETKLFKRSSKTMEDIFTDKKSVDYLKYKFYNNILDRDLKNEQQINTTLQDKLVRLLLTFSRSLSVSNSDFINISSEIVRDISSDIFLNLNSDNLDKEKINSDYSRLNLLMIILSFSLNFVDANKVLNNKSFVEKFSHLYLLLINLLIINFVKLYSNKQDKLNKKDAKSCKNQDSKDSISKKKKSENIDEDKILEKELKLFNFISGILGENILNSHCLINDHWIEVDIKEIQKVDNSRNNIRFWKLESSILTLLSIFVLKLNAKNLKEFTILVKKLIHRNGESFLSKVNDLFEKSDFKINKNKSSVKDLYNEFLTNQKMNLTKDIYSYRIWILILLTIIDTTNDYGVYCLIDEVVLDIKSINDLIQMNALTCIQNNTIIQYKNTHLPKKKSPNNKQIASLNILSNDCGWYWYHLGIYNLLLIKFIYKSLSNQEDDSKDIPTSIEENLINPIVTNLDMFALFDNSTYEKYLGCGEQWKLILNDIWISTVKCFRNNDLIIANIIKLLLNKLRNGNDRVRIFSADTLLLLWKDETCSITILSHLSDLLPIIKELLGDNSEEIINIAKSIVKKIEERTGQEISKQLV